MGSSGLRSRVSYQLQKWPRTRCSVGHGPQSSLEPLRHVQNPDPAVVVGSHRTQEIETQVRRRSAVGFDRLRVLLKIVRRKGMLLLVDERFEEAPGPAGDEAQGSRLLGGENL